MTGIVARLSEPRRNNVVERKLLQVLVSLVSLLSRPNTLFKCRRERKRLQVTLVSVPLFTVDGVATTMQTGAET